MAVLGASNWSTAVALARHQPVYYLAIDGYTTEHFSTAPVKNVAGGSGISKTVLMDLPRISGGDIDIITGAQTVQTLEVDLVDIDDQITDLISTDQASPPLAAIINKTVTVYAGFRDLDEADYQTIFVGRIRGLRMSADLTRYTLTASDPTYLIDGDVMTNAVENAPTCIEGNVVNVFWSLLTGTFSLAGDFPLDYISTAGGVKPNASSNPAGFAWVNPENAYSGDSSTTSGPASTAYAYVDYTFAAGTETGRVVVEGCQIDEATDDGGELFILYSVDSGTTFTLMDTVTGTTAKTVTSPILEAQDMSLLVVRCYVTPGSGATTGIIDEITFNASAPTGLGLSTAVLDETQMAAERDAWHPSDSVRVVVIEPRNAKDYLSREFLRIFQAFVLAGGDGLIGMKFHTPAMPATSATQVTANHVLNLSSWERLYRDHLNKFRFYGDYDPDDAEYDSTLYETDLSEDTTDRTNTGETIEYRAESEILRSGLNGAEISAELAGRMRIRYLKTPAEVVLDVPMTFVETEVGDVIALTHPELPDLRAGTRGITDRLMTVVSVSPLIEQGLMRLTLLDTNLSRYGVVAPAGQADYTSATTLQQDSFAFASDTDPDMSNGDEAYYLV